MGIKVNLGKGYEIKLGRIEKLPTGFIITDKNLASKYPELLERRGKFIIEPGEKSKNLDVYREILEEIKDKKIDRIIGFGGGVVGDLSGFVASTYKRGVELIHIPTSLIGMVDSSIGGKTGVNLGKNKNYVGSFYQPEKVLIDPNFLATLPEKEFKSGLAEVIKYGAIFERPDLNKIGKVKKNGEINEIIKKCCEVKARVVEKDVLDAGYRHTLNFGHTIGHAIELLAGLKHGEAISIGMIKELELGEKLGYVNGDKKELVKNTLKKNGLPVEMPNIDIDKAIGLMRYDKKGSMVFVFDENNYNVKVDRDKIREVLECK